MAYCGREKCKSDALHLSRERECMLLTSLQSLLCFNIHQKCFSCTCSEFTTANNTYYIYNPCTVMSSQVVKIYPFCVLYIIGRGNPAATCRAEGRHGSGAVAPSSLWFAFFRILERSAQNFDCMLIDEVCIHHNMYMYKL